MSHKIDESAILLNLERGILDTFSYPKSIMGKVKDNFDSYESTISNKYDTSLFKKTYEKFIKKCKNEFFLEKRRARMLQHFTASIRETFRDDKVPGRTKLKFTLPTKEEQIYVGRRTAVNWYYGKQMKDVYKNYIIYDDQTIRNQPEYVVRSKVYETKNVVEILNKLFKTTKLTNQTAGNLLGELNTILKASYDILVSYFIEDMVHNEHLDEVIDFQTRISKVLNKVKGLGSLDTTREIAANIVNYLLRFGFEHKDFQFNFNGKTIAIEDVTKAWAYPTSIYLDLRDKCKNGVSIVISNTIEKYLKDNSNSYNYTVRKDTENTFKITPGKGSSIRSKTDLKNLFGLSNPFIYTIDIALSPLKFSSKVDLTILDYVQIVNKNTIRVKRVEEVLKHIQVKLQKKILIDGKKKEYEVFEIISRSTTSNAIEIRTFDLIDHFLDMASDIHKFFAETMNLKAITEKVKYYEIFDGSRDLDIEKTINQSIARSEIYPIQSYKKKLMESDPTIYMVYDISESMKLVHRLTQFLVVIILSFFEKNANKFFTGYITTLDRGDGYDALFRSEMEDAEENQRKLEAYMVDEGFPYEFLQERTQTDLISTLGEIANDYYDIETALRDFLDNSELVGSGTRMDIYNLIPYHPDIYTKGLKYVLVITDAALDSDDLVDFVSTSQELVDRDDVRLFFLWIVQEDERASVIDDSNFNNTSDTSRHFITRQQIMRKIDSLTRTAAGKMKKRDDISDDDFAKINFYLFIYNHWDKCHLVNAENLEFVGEIKNIMNKLSEQRFFIP